MKPFECASFRNRQGLMLHGMLHVPDPEVARGICVLMLSPGIKGRVGPHRLYLKLAERLVPLGFHLLRFDFYGLGDSEGELAEDVLADVYNTIQGGRYADDAIAAMDWMQGMHGVRRFVGSGLCGGSITALHAAARDRRIEALLGIGLPVVLDGGEVNWGRFLTEQQKQQARRGLFERLFRPRSWWKFVSGGSNYRVIWRVLLQIAGLRKSPPPSAATAVMDDTNPLFAPAFLDMIDRGSPMLLVYSGGDRLQSQFEEKFEARHRDRLGDGRRGYRLHTIPQANHIMSAPEWVADLCETSARWLQEELR
ncbi:MAG TPA: alpha/beta fold hydrolase [Steroidobacteraceae bacterium]|nr:alpha/beta fold hydrolase [Steroidobacteraceae bacterium]